jgi:phage tail-like protein
MPDPTPADVPPAGAQTGQLGQRPDPLRAYNFTLQIDNANQGFFTQLKGLEVRVAPIRYREGNDQRTTRMLAGPVEYGEVTLRYGLTESRVLWDWLTSAVTGVPQRKNISIIMQGPDGTGERVRWNLTDAWACAWRGAQLDALGREVAIESVTIVCEKIDRG